jgi:NAD(P)-dependent dehydrogenase (short-subunit alcohol dehydrogenase family)
MAKRVVMTGGATGMGAAAVTRLLHAGCSVHVLDVAPPTDARVAFTPCDLGDPMAIDRAVASLATPIDALVNVAGIATADPPERVLAVNFLGLRYLTEALLPRIAQGGVVVNVASTAGWDWQKRTDVVNAMLDTASFADGLAWARAHRTEWEANPYKFSKQCAAAYTHRATGRALAHRVRVNCVNPGSTETQLTPAFRKLVGEAMYDWGVAQIGRQGTPEDIAEVIEWLAIGQNRWLNGVEIIVDGGYLSGVVGGWIDLERSPNAKR